MFIQVVNDYFSWRDDECERLRLQLSAENTARLTRRGLVISFAQLFDALSDMKRTRVKYSCHCGHSEWKEQRIVMEMELKCPDCGSENSLVLRHGSEKIRRTVPLHLRTDESLRRVMGNGLSDADISFIRHELAQEASARDRIRREIECEARERQAGV